MYSVGESVSLNCVDTSGTASLVQWLNSSTGAVLSSGSSAATLSFSTVTDTHHGLQYVCRVHSSGVARDSNYTIIVLGKYSLFSVSINVVQHWNTCRS